MTLSSNLIDTASANLQIIFDTDNYDVNIYSSNESRYLKGDTDGFSRVSSERTNIYLYESYSTGSTTTYTLSTTALTVEQGGTVDFSGITLTITENGTAAEPITYDSDSKFVIDSSNVNTSVAGTYSAPVTYDGVSVGTITVTVNAASSTGTTYKLATTLVPGKEYLIVNSNETNATEVRVAYNNKTAAGDTKLANIVNGILTLENADDATRSLWKFEESGDNYIVSNDSWYLWLGNSAGKVLQSTSTALSINTNNISTGTVQIKSVDEGRYLAFDGEDIKSRSSAYVVYLFEPTTSVEATCDFTVTPESLTFTVGDATQTITETVANATVNGEAADSMSYTIAWTPSNTSVATVADGVVTAVSAGTANITATATVKITKDGKTYNHVASKVVPATVNPKPPTNFEITIPDVSVTVGKTDTIEPIIRALVDGEWIEIDSSLATVEWELTSGDTIASVDEAGVVKGLTVSDTKAVVTATLKAVSIDNVIYEIATIMGEDAEISDTANVTVTAATTAEIDSYIYSRAYDAAKALNGLRYVIIQNSSDGTTMFGGKVGTGSDSYELTKLESDVVTFASGLREEVVWTFEQAEKDTNTYYIKDLAGNYLYATDSAITESTTQKTTSTVTYSSGKYKISWKYNDTTYGLKKDGDKFMIDSSGGEMRFYHDTKVVDLTIKISYEAAPAEIKFGSQNLSGAENYIVKVTVTDKNGNDVTSSCSDIKINWTSGKEDIFTVEDESTTTAATASNKVTAKAKGTANLVATVESFVYDGMAYTSSVWNSNSVDVATTIIKTTAVTLTSISLKPATIYVRKNGVAGFSALEVVSKYSDNSETAITSKDLVVYHSAYDSSKPGTYSNVYVYHKGTRVVDKDGNELKLTLVVMDDPYYGLTDTNITPVYPNEGAVRIDKTATNDEGFTFNDTGVTKIELDVAGITKATAVDVVLVVDFSNSMAWSDNWFDGLTDEQAAAKVDKDKIPSTDATDTAYPDKLDQAMEIAQDFADVLLGDNVADSDEDSVNNNFLTFVTFAGYDVDNISSGDKDEDLIDSVQTVFTGVEDAEKANTSFANTKFTKYTVGSSSTTVTLQISDEEGNKVTGINRGNTNYDYAFAQANQAVTELHAAYAANNDGKTYAESGRETVVVFMTDGAASHYNNQRYNGTAADLVWNTTSAYPGKLSTTDAGWLTKMMIPNQYAVELKTNDVDDIYAVGFDLNHGGYGDKSWTQEELRYVLEGLAGTGHVTSVELAENHDELDIFFDTLAENLTHPGTSAAVNDIINADFNLELGTTIYDLAGKDLGIQPKIEITTYDLYTKADATNTSEIGTRKTDGDGNYISNVIETVWRDTNGAVYSTAVFTDVDKDGIFDEGTDTYTNIEKTENGVTTITGKYITYTLASDGTGDLDWNIGDITDKEIVLSFYEKLDSEILENETFGIYETNAGATLESGNLLWTVTFKATIRGTSEYTVTGYGLDGTAGASASDTLKGTTK